MDDLVNKLVLKMYVFKQTFVCFYRFNSLYNECTRDSVFDEKCYLLNKDLFFALSKLAFKKKYWTSFTFYPYYLKVQSFLRKPFGQNSTPKLVGALSYLEEIRTPKIFFIFYINIPIAFFPVAYTRLG